MPDIAPGYYLYTTLIMLILAMASISLVIRNIKGTQLPFTSIKVFYVYFLLGLIGFLVTGVRHILDIPANLTSQLIFFTICSFLLYVAVAECLRKKWPMLIVGGLHLLLLIIPFILTDLKTQLIYASVYSFIIYSLIGFLVLRKSIINSNIGYGIIGFATISFVIVSFISISNSYFSIFG